MCGYVWWLIVQSALAMYEHCGLIHPARYVICVQTCTLFAGTPALLRLCCCRSCLLLSLLRLPYVNLSLWCCSCSSHVTGAVLTRPVVGWVFVFMRCAREGLLHAWGGMSLRHECAPRVNIYLSIYLSMYACWLAVVGKSSIGGLVP